MIMMNYIMKLFLILLLGSLVSCKSNKHSIKEYNISNNLTLNYVPNADTAIKIAEAIWLPIYGDDILTQKPFIADLRDGVWYVSGSLVGLPNEKIVGGVAYIEIQQSDCKILKVTHSK